MVRGGADTAPTVPTPGVEVLSTPRRLPPMQSRGTDDESQRTPKLALDTDASVTHHRCRVRAWRGFLLPPPPARHRRGGARSGAAGDRRRGRAGPRPAPGVAAP